MKNRLAFVAVFALVSNVSSAETLVCKVSEHTVKGNTSFPTEYTLQSDAPAGGGAIILASARSRTFRNIGMNFTADPKTADGPSHVEITFRDSGSRFRKPSQTMSSAAGEELVSYYSVGENWIEANCSFR